MFSIARWYTVQTHNTILCLFVYCFRLRLKKGGLNARIGVHPRVWTKQKRSLQLIVVGIIGVAPPSHSARWRFEPGWATGRGSNPCFIQHETQLCPSTTLCIYVILCNNPGTNKCMDAMPVSGYLMKTEHPTLKNHMKQRWSPWQDYTIRGP